MTNKTNQKLNILCFSNQVWDSTFWTNKKHAMSRLGTAGHNVIFVDPLVNFGRTLFGQVLSGLWSFTRALGFSTYDATYNVTTFSPIVYVPVKWVVRLYMRFALRRLMRKHFDPHNPVVVWVYHVQLTDLFYYLDHLTYDVLVYDCVDNYDAFPPNQSLFPVIVDGEELHKQEIRLTREADVVFASAPGLVKKLKPYNTNIHFTPNVGDSKKYANCRSLKVFPPDMADIKALGKPVVGFVGALDAYKFDLDLYRATAQACPEFNFVLIGKLAVKDRNTQLGDLGLAELGNVFYLGPKDYETLENYMGGFDAFTIPYVLNEYTISGCFPIKFHEALGAGLPTIVTDLPAYEPFKDVCYVSKSTSDFIHNLKIAIAEDSPEKIARRQEVARENDWEGKVNKMISEVATLLED